MLVISYAPTHEYRPTLTKHAQNKLVAAQTNMEISMPNSTHNDKKHSIWVRERTKVLDIIINVRKLKYDRWTSRIPIWRPHS